MFLSLHGHFKSCSSFRLTFQDLLQFPEHLKSTNPARRQNPRTVGRTFVFKDLSLPLKRVMNDEKIVKNLMALLLESWYRQCCGAGRSRDKAGAGVGLKVRLQLR